MIQQLSTCNLNIQRNSHAPKLGTRNRYRESSEFDIETSNRFSPLTEADESLNEQLQQNSDNKRAKNLTNWKLPHRSHSS